MFFNVLSQSFLEKWLDLSVVYGIAAVFLGFLAGSHRI